VPRRLGAEGPHRNDSPRLPQVTGWSDSSAHCWRLPTKGVVGIVVQNGYYGTFALDFEKLFDDLTDNEHKWVAAETMELSGWGTTTERDC
jgi:hypothetical protein